MNTLVLGGSVFVGRHLVLALHESGHQVTVLNRGVTPSVLPAGVAHLAADRTETESMRRVLSGREWDAVFDVSGFVMAAGGADFAGLVGMLDGSVGRYVYVSSIMAYEPALAGCFPWTEDLPTDSSGPATYGGFKSLVESELLDRHRSTGFPAVVAPASAEVGRS